MKHEEERATFLWHTGASHEAMAKLDRYAELLTEWGAKFNLVAPSTLPHIWSRHFLDSAQLFPMLPPQPNKVTVADLGSGAGFPGLVLSIMGQGNIHLIESTGKKADFLRAVIAELRLKAEVHQARIEEMQDFKADIITARALASLSELFPYVARLMKKETFCLFLKGQSVDAELTEAKKYWMFELDKTPSLTDPSASILTIRNLKNDGKFKLPRRK